MTFFLFRDDDTGYLAWLAAHPAGYVINIARRHNATQARVHHAGCRTICGQISVGTGWTKQYVKVCAEHLAELEQWAIETVGQPISPCGTCHPASVGVQPTSTKHPERTADGRAYTSGADEPGAGDVPSVRGAAGSPPTASFDADPHPSQCLWDGKADQSCSDWDSVVDWALYHASAWRRWQLLCENLDVADTAVWVEITWNGAVDHSKHPAEQLAYIVRCVTLLRSLGGEFAAHPELREWLDRLTPELERRWHGETCAAGPTSTKPSEQAKASPLPEGRSEIHGPVVEAWADDYIRFERRPVWQEHLRNEIRARCSQLEPSAGQVLHATFFGDKLPNADVENLVLYNIDSFAVAGRNGIRFEHGAGVPPAPDGARYRCCYRYALTPRSGSFTHWRQGRTLASFDWIDLGAFGVEKQLAQVWLALSRALRDDNPGQMEVFEPAAPETPFAVRVQVRPLDDGRQPVWGGLVKGIFDGVICAFQAHTDTTVLPEVAARLARYLPADPAEIAEHLLDQRGAVLGVVPRLVSPYRQDVKWDPADHWCLAGELLRAEPDGPRAEPVGPRWAIKGKLIEVTR
jgi:hypothetical protein